MNRHRRMDAFVASNPAYFHAGSIEGVAVNDVPGPAGPLLPTEAEIAGLPRSARRAFAGRCIARVAPLDPTDPATPPDDPAGVAVFAAVASDALVRAATVRTPVTRQLRAIRRDFDRISKLAAANGWTADTPVPPDAFGPLWPDGPPSWWPAD